MGLSGGKSEMILDWNEYQKQLGARIGELAKLSPHTVRGYQRLTAANSKTGKLDEKTRQLISLAVAVRTHCHGCIFFHTEAVLRAGASKKKSQKHQASRRP
jgi:AhpD family alkylhydroperoxidase